MKGRLVRDGRRRLALSGRECQLSIGVVLVVALGRVSPRRKRRAATLSRGTSLVASSACVSALMEPISQHGSSEMDMHSIESATAKDCIYPIRPRRAPAKPGSGRDIVRCLGTGDGALNTLIADGSGVRIPQSAPFPIASKYQKSVSGRTPAHFENASDEPHCAKRRHRPKRVTSRLQLRRRLATLELGRSRTVKPYSSSHQHR